MHHATSAPAQTPRNLKNINLSHEDELIMYAVRIVGQLVRQSDSQPVSQSASRQVVIQCSHESVSQSVSQSANQPASHSLSLQVFVSLWFSFRMANNTRISLQRVLWRKILKYFKQLYEGGS